MLVMMKGLFSSPSDSQREGISVLNRKLGPISPAETNGIGKTDREQT